MLDTGKPIREALVTDVHSGADCLEYYGGVIAGCPVSTTSSVR